MAIVREIIEEYVVGDYHHKHVRYSYGLRDSARLAEILDSDESYLRGYWRDHKNWTKYAFVHRLERRRIRDGAIPPPEESPIKIV